MSARDEAARLEALWSGEFGDAYVERNAAADAGREPFWRERVAALGITSALEIGCNVGANLTWLAGLLGEENVAGVDVNRRALEIARERMPGADLRETAARSLPFPDAAYDLVFTVGVLIHQPPAELPAVMDEIVRCARRYVLCAEYHADQLTEVPYRGESAALFKQDYGRLYAERFPQLELVESGFLDEGSWDRVTYWTFRK